jgi:hypothetical protein
MRDDPGGAGLAMTRLLAAFALFSLLALPAAAAEWAVRPAPAEDGGLPAAAITNADGHTLYLWPRNGPNIYQIFAEIHLGGASGFADAMPRYRIDDGDVVDTDLVRQAGEKESALWGHVGDKVAFWRAWSSDEAVIRTTDPFHAWLTGKTLHVTYKAADGATNTTSFPLDGLNEAVAAATGVKLP